MIVFPPLIQHTQFNCTDVPTMANAIKAGDLAVGWTSTDTFQTGVITFFGQPFDGQTMTINATTFTWRNTVVFATDIGIGGTIAITATNTAGVLNANLATQIVATATATTTVIRAINGGFNANSTFSQSGLPFGNLNFAFATARGYRLLSVATGDGLRMATSLWDGNTFGRGNKLYLTVESTDGIVNSDNPGVFSFELDVSPGRTLEMRAHAYGYMTWLANNSGTPGCQFGCLTPHLHAGQIPVVITGISISGTTVTVTTSTPLGLIPGTDIFISEADGTTGVNGFHTIATISGTTFTFTATASGSYTGSGARVGGTNTLSRCFIGWGDTDGSGYQNTFRNQFGLSHYFACANQYSFAAGSFGSGGNRAQLCTLRTDTPQDYYFWGNFSTLTEPMLGWPSTALGSVFNVMGQDWGSFCVTTDQPPLDSVRLAFQGHDWLNFTAPPGGSGNPHGTYWIALN